MLTHIRNINKKRVLNLGLIKFSSNKATTRCLTQKSNAYADSDYRAVPHYTEKSALFITQPSVTGKKPASDEHSVFPKIISPELDLNAIFCSKNIVNSTVNLNLAARHIHLDLAKLKDDYLVMKRLENELEALEKQKEEASLKMSELVKAKGGVLSKKLTMQTDEAKELLNFGAQIKTKINKILKDLIPLEEKVKISCLRLPNDLHSSTFYLHNINTNKDSESNQNINQYSHFDCEQNQNLVLFQLDENYKNKIEKNAKILSSSKYWQYVLDDTNIVLDNNLNNIEQRESEKLTFIEPSSFNSCDIKYSVGAYAKIEQALVNYVYDRINGLRKEVETSPSNEELDYNFEHIKSMSTFKSAIIEGSGQNFNDTRKIFNIVRFSGSLPEKNKDSKKKSDPKQQQQQHSNIELLHLNGNSSLHALVLNFVRTQISESYLPWTVFTNGKCYSPKQGQINCFDMLTLCADKSKFLVDEKYNKALDQGNIEPIIKTGMSYLDEIRKELAQFFRSCKEIDLSKELLHTKDKTIDRILIDVLKLMVYVYKDFNLPIRFNFINPNELNSNESLRIEIECYLPSERTYVTVSEFSKFKP